jgi:hypothetical protein
LIVKEVQNFKDIESGKAQADSEPASAPSPVRRASIFNGKIDEKEVSKMPRYTDGELIEGTSIEEELQMRELKISN